MKRTVAAGIVRVLEFEQDYEADDYLLDLAWKQIKFKVNFQEHLEDGRVILNVTTAYNNSTLIERIKEIAEEGEANGKDQYPEHEIF